MKIRSPEAARSSNPAREAYLRRSSLVGGAFVLFLSALVLGAGGCSSEAAPTLTIVSPTDGETVCGTPLHVKLDVQNFVLVADTDEGGEEEEPTPGSEPSAASQGEGHVHVFLNSDYVDQLETAEADIVNPVADGEYQLKVELVNADHTKLEPAVDDFIYITVDNSKCSSALTAM